MKDMIIHVPADLEGGLTGDAAFVCNDDGCKFRSLHVGAQTIKDESEAWKITDVGILALDARDLYDFETKDSELEELESEDEMNDPDHAAKVAFAWGNRK